MKKKHCILFTLLLILSSCERDELDELMYRQSMLVRGLEDFEIARHEMQKTMCFIFRETAEKLNKELYASATRDWKIYAQRLKSDIEKIRYNFNEDKNKFSLVQKGNRYFQKLSKTTRLIGQEDRKQNPQTALDSIEGIRILKYQEKQNYEVLKKQWEVEISKADQHIENLNQSVEIAQSYYTVLKTTSMRQSMNGAKENLFDMLMKLQKDILELRNVVLKLKCLINYRNETKPSIVSRQNESYTVCNGLFPEAKKKEINTNLDWVIRAKSQFKCTKNINLYQNGINSRK